MNPILYFSIFIGLVSYAEPIHGTGASDPSTYEAITGESPEEDRSIWDTFYKNKNHIFGNDAASFLKENLKKIPKGKAFVPAMGEGRNAIFLAKKGFTVEGNDLSEVAVDRALQEAKHEHLNIKGSVADLLKITYPSEYYDLIVVSEFYMESLNPKFIKALKRGGYILFYEKLDTGKPQKKFSPDDFLVKSTDLKNALKDLEMKAYREYEENGAKVVGALARKP